MIRRLLLCFIGFLTLGLGGQVGYAQKLHGIVISDLSPWAGWGVHRGAIAGDALRMYVELHSQVPASQLEYYSLSMEEDEFSSPQAILDLLADVKPGSNDTLLVYYTGHGASDDRGHHLDLAGGKLYRDDLKRLMESKGARFNALITDCCNLRADGEDFFAPFVMPDEPRVISPLFRSLFFSDAGWLDLNGSSPGEAAFIAANVGDANLPGSIFTTALCRFWEANRSRPVGWERLIRDVSLEVAAAFKADYPKGAKVNAAAAPQMEQNVDAISYPGKPQRSGPRSGLTVRDRGGAGAVITLVAAGLPGERVFDLSRRDYRALRPGEVVVAANGQQVTSARQFAELVKQSPQVMRLKVDSQGRAGEVLLRLRY